MSVVTAICLAAAGGVAYASIPGENGVINGCYEKRTGILRVIDAQMGKACLSIETPISWSQQGPKGDAGVAGSQGPQGPAGAQGPPGAAGPTYVAPFQGGLLLEGNQFSIAPNGVTSPRIQDREVKNVDLDFDSVTGPKILNGTVTADDLAADSVSGNKIQNGSIEAADLAPGVTGVDCPGGTVKILDFCTETLLRLPSTWSFAQVNCEQGGKHLPSLVQIHAVVFVGPLISGVTGDLQAVFSDDLFNGGVMAPRIAKTSSFGTINLANTAALGDSLPFFCVVNPS